MIFNESYFDELGKSAPVERIVRDVAESVAATARASAPVDTRAYRDGIQVEVIQAKHRVVAKVIATDKDSMIIESKTGNLVRALRSGTRGG